ncbi:MAG: hypothetical protein V3V13_08605 [Paracoccaceae bacterium]
MRVSAGAIVPLYAVDFSINGPVTYEGTAYAGVDIDGKISAQNSIAPMLSIGYETKIASNWGVSIDAGAIFTGGFVAKATSNNAVIPTTDFDDALADINSELGKYGIMPYLKLGISYSF